MKQEIEAFLAAYPVTYETTNRLTRYAEMLVDWNTRMNLVAESTLEHIWTRHFLDSAQLMPLIPKGAQLLADIGAGAGFPGLVLAILALEQGRSLRVHSIESTGKKAEFLRAVVDELKLDVIVRNERVENIRDLKADVITARAVKALPELLKFAKGLIKKETCCFFLKGKTLTEELTQAEKYWTFDAEIQQSRSDDSGKVLILKNLRYGH
jgi:16S rRNA (guanine527-N7)-methyltransferase